MAEDVLLPIIIVFIVIGIPVLCGTAIAMKKMGANSKSSKTDAEEAKIMQELHKGLTKMEKRIESLETIIIDKK